MFGWSSTETVGNIALLLSICLYLAGLTICFEIFKRKSVGDISAFPFLSGIFNCLINFMYGYLVNNKQIKTVTVVGFNLEVFYVFFFLFYCSNKRKVLNQFALIIAINASISYYAFVLSRPSSSDTINLIGSIAAVVNIVMYGSPLASLNAVLKTKSTESLSFPLCFVNLLCSLFWTAYGFMLKDRFLLMPNLLGGFLAFILISLFFKFPRSSSTLQAKNYIL